jgi:hypothetical protein
MRSASSTEERRTNASCGRPFSASRAAKGELTYADNMLEGHASAKALRKLCSFHQPPALPSGSTPNYLLVVFHEELRHHPACARIRACTVYQRLDVLRARMLEGVHQHFAHPRLLRCGAERDHRASLGALRRGISDTRTHGIEFGTPATAYALGQLVS